MANTINYDNFPPIIHYMGRDYMGGVMEGNSGNAFNYNVVDAHVATNGHYITDAPLDVELESNKYYVIALNDPSKNTTAASIFYYSGSNMSIYMVGANGDYAHGNYTVVITSSTVGVSTYSSNWREMYATISELDPLQMCLGE